MLGKDLVLPGNGQTNGQRAVQHGILGATRERLAQPTHDRGGRDVGQAHGIHLARLQVG